MDFPYAAITVRTTNIAIGAKTITVPENTRLTVHGEFETSGTVSVEGQDERGVTMRSNYRRV